MQITMKACDVCDAPLQSKDLTSTQHTNNPSPSRFDREVLRMIQFLSHTRSEPKTHTLQMNFLILTNNQLAADTTSTLNRQIF